MNDAPNVPDESTEAEGESPAGDKFNWRDVSVVICEQQPMTAVYWNIFGQAVIRQQQGLFCEDIFLLFNKEHLPALIAALIQRHEEAEAEDPVSGAETITPGRNG